MKEILFALFAVLALLLPIGMYCLILASINRRGKPVVVSGTWDAIGLLFALSGFFLVTMPMLFSEFFARTIGAEGTDHLLGFWAEHWIIWLVYLLFLLSGIALMILLRVHKTLIYNVDPSQFPSALERTLAHVGLSAVVKQQRWILAPSMPVQGGESTAITEAQPRPVAIADDSRHGELAIETFSPMCHVTLHWENYTPAVRQQVEAELEKNLASLAPVENPAAGWFLNISGMIFGALIVASLTFVSLVFFSKRG